MGLRHRFERVQEKSGVIVPGLPVLPHGVERHVVPGGGSRGIKIEKGDEISIMDRDGLQMGELVFFTPDGVSDAGMIGGKGEGPPLNIIETLATGDSSGRKVLKALSLSGFDIWKGEAIRIFKEGSRPGETADFFAACDGLLIVAAPGGPMLPEEQNSTTDLVAYVRRARPSQGKGGLLPPEPLADPIHDINIQPGNAISFDWKVLSGVKIPKPWILAGGLDKNNVANAIKTTGAKTVDVSTGVEDKLGVKGIRKIIDFIEATKKLS